MQWNLITEAELAPCAAFLDNLSAHPDVVAYKGKTLARLNLKPGLRVLDAGCGTGADVLAIGKLIGSTGSVLGIDNSAAMIALAAERSQNQSTNISFLKMDVQSMELPVDYFDRVRTDRVLQHVENPEKAIRNLVKVTSPRGLIYLSEPDWDTLVIDSVDRELTAMVKSLICAAIPQFDLGRRLPALLRENMLENVSCEADTLIFQSFQEADQVLRLSETIALGYRQGLFPERKGEQWLTELKQLHEDGKFFAAITGFGISGWKRNYENHT